MKQENRGIGEPGTFTILLFSLKNVQINHRSLVAYCVGLAIGLELRSLTSGNFDFICFVL